MQINNPVILLVEDNEEDFYTTKRALKKAGLSNNIYRCADGADALDYLFNREKYNNPQAYPKPNMILLDLNLPKVNGHQVLQQIKSDENLRSIPVIILTTSDNEEDIKTCFKYGANSYMQKPVDINRFFKSIQRLTDYWFEITLLPKDTA